jgi:hypothetical protein
MVCQTDFLRVMCLVIVLAEEKEIEWVVGAKRVLNYEIRTEYFLFYSRVVKLHSEMTCSNSRIKYDTV